MVNHELRLNVNKQFEWFQTNSFTYRILKRLAFNSQQIDKPISYQQKWLLSSYYEQICQRNFWIVPHN